MIVEMHSRSAGKFAAQEMRVPGKSILKSAVTLLKTGGLTLLYILAFAVYSAAQTRQGSVVDSVHTSTTDTVRLSQRDTLASATDSTIADSTRRTALEDSLGIRISPDALPSIVTAKATDSAVMDMQRNLFYLYGDAQ